GNFDLLLCEEGMVERIETVKIPVIVLAPDSSTIQRFNDSTTQLFHERIDFVLKPVRLPELIWRIGTALGRKQTIDELTRRRDDLKAARVTAEETARAKAEFLANMS